jgi:hexosaminidase
MPEKIILLPHPRNLQYSDGTLPLSGGRLILIDHAPAHSLLSTGKRLQEALHRRFGLHWEITASSSVPDELIGLTLTIDPHITTEPQGYELVIDTQGITITGSDEAGVFYGVCTLIQVMENQEVVALPCFRALDFPDFPVRGVMLDISRDKVPTMQTLLALVDLLASWKINQFQLYTEHTFAYRSHPEVWAKASPITGEEILELDSYCRERYIDLVPNQNSFGHMHRWLDLPRYSSLGELSGVEVDNWWGKGSFSLCPIDPKSITLIQSLYDELLPHFSSRLFNVGCDETFDLGVGRSKEACETQGKGRVYLNFLLKINQAVRAHDRTMQFWGDIIIQSPELVNELPKDIIALEWGYEESQPPAENCAQFAAAGIPFYVCPGTSSWNSIGGRTNNALENLRTAAVNGKEYGAIGYLITDWGDNGHWQVLPVSYTGYAAGAAFSWCYKANQAIRIADAVSLHAFHDTTLRAGQVAYDLGNVYTFMDFTPPNNSALFLILQNSVNQLKEYEDTYTETVLKSTLEAIDAAINPLSEARVSAPYATLLQRELVQTAHLLRHACHRALFAFEKGQVGSAALYRDIQQIIAEFREVWLSRNRPGGLSDSLARFEKTRQDYTN